MAHINLIMRGSREITVGHTNRTTQNMIFSVRLDLVFYHPTLLNTKSQFFDI